MSDDEEADAPIILGMQPPRRRQVGMPTQHRPTSCVTGTATIGRSTLRPRMHLHPTPGALPRWSGQPTIPHFRVPIAVTTSLQTHFDARAAEASSTTARGVTTS